MGRTLWETASTRRAEQFILEQGIDSLPICPFEIADQLDISVEPLPPQSKGVSGMLLRQDKYYGIMYATYIDNEGFQRFCVSHELAHYLLPGHPESVLVDGMHTSQAGFVSKNRYELEADHFAAGLLMPKNLFGTAMDKAGDGLAAIEKLSNDCLTSLTATAIRYAQQTPEAVAIVVSIGSKIDYCFMSDSLRELPGLDWPHKGMPLPLSVITRKFNSDNSNILLSRRDENETTLQDWFGSSLDIEMYEEVIGLGQYEKTLTVLSASEIPDLDEIEDEEALIESWTPRFRR